MKKTYGHKLLGFANSVDILEEDNFQKIQKYIETYLADVLRIKYVRLMLIRETMGGDIILVKYALNKNLDQPLLIVKRGEEYNGHMAYAFSEGCKLWINPQNEDETLNKCNISDYVDHWSKRKDLPQFQQISNETNIKTSVIIPISRDNTKNSKNHYFGVVNFESESYLKPNSKAQEELENISYTLGKLFQLQEGRNFQKQNTASVIEEFDKDLKYLKDEFKGYFFEQTPKIFFAFSSRADKEVIECTKALINSKYAEQLSLIAWDENNVGQITPQLLNNMSISEYFICYLSEKDEEELKYIDNPNVLIELGCFIGKHEHDSFLRNILIIRETDSLKDVPFDIKDIFSLDVTRNEQTQEVDEEKFMNSLSVKINNILN